MSLCALVAALMAGVAPSTLSGQEIGGLVLQASSPNPEFPEPSGFGIYGEVEIRQAWIFRLTYTRLNDEVGKAGTVCQVYSPRIECLPEYVNTTSQMGGLRLTAMRSLHVGRARLAGGGGLSFNSLDVDAVGETGRPADLLLPKAGQTGYHAMVTLGVQPLASVPLRLSASYGGNWVRFKGCADPEDPTSGYDPFCGTDRFDEIQFGASLILPRMPGW